MNKRNIIIIVIILVIAAQFIRPAKISKEVDPESDFISVEQTPEDVAKIIKSACYDCHSNQPRYPWYFSITPVNWYLNRHITHGSHHLNFSTWGDMSSEDQQHAIKEIIEVMEEKEMPLKSYKMLHKSARLSKEEIKMVIGYFEMSRSNLDSSTLNIY